MGAVPCVKEWLDCEELPLRNSHKQAESLWVKIKDSTDKGHLAGAYYKLPDQGEPDDKAFLLQLQEASCSQGLILMEEFNHVDVG